MNTSFRHEIERMDSIMSVCGGNPHGDELPQTGSLDDIMIGLVSACTGKTSALVDIELHHQTDSSYQ